MNAYPTQTAPAPEPTGEIPDMPPPPMPTDSPSGGEVLPLISNGFEVTTATAGSSGLPLWALIAASIGVLLCLAGIVAAIYVRPQHERLSWVAIGVSYVGAVIAAIAFVAGSALSGPTAAEGYAGSAPELVVHAEANYQVEITTDQARQLLAGRTVAVDYLGTRIAVEAALAADGKLYLLNGDGFQLPATDEEYGIPDVDTTPLPEK